MSELNSLKGRIEGVKLTDAQVRALSAIARHPRSRINFSVGEALRKRGLVTRYTTYSILAHFANESGVHVQYRRDPDCAMAIHEWELTKAGRALLSKETDHE